METLPGDLIVVLTDTLSDISKVSIVVLAHVSKFCYHIARNSARRNHILKKLECHEIAAEGLLEILKWVRSEGYDSNSIVYKMTTAIGFIDTPLWIKSFSRLPWDSRTCKNAVMNGHLEILKWIISEGCKVNNDIMECAVQYGQLEILEWVRSLGCNMDVWVCSYAAMYGQLEVLKWARSHGFSWNMLVAHGAAQNDHLELLKWARDNGCEWDIHTEIIAKNKWPDIFS